MKFTGAFFRIVEGAVFIRITRVAALVSLLAVTFLLVGQYERDMCWNRYAADSAVAQIERARAAESDRQAIDALMRSVAQNPRSAIKAINEYNAARAAGNEQRARNPLPAPPAAMCGKR